MNHSELAVDALENITRIDPMSLTAFADVQRLTAFATTHAMLAQAEAVNHHTDVIVGFMAASLTNTQAKMLLEALTGLGNKIKP